jgi:transposase
MKKYEVRLNEEQRRRLQKLTRSGKGSVRAIRTAHILLKSDAGWTDEAIGEALGVTAKTVHNVRKRCVKDGAEATVEIGSGRRVGTVAKALDGVAEAHLIALACGEPPEGRARWTLRLLSERMVQLDYVSAVSHETVRTTLKKMNLSLGSNKPGASRPSKTRRL